MSDISYEMRGELVAMPDFLDEVIDERTRSNASFPALVDAALDRRQLLRELAGERESRRLSQTAVAARMGTSQSAVARLEAGDIDVRFSTVERYATALGVRVRWRIERESIARQAPAPPADPR